jgi:predicted Zn-dependent peptidase
MRTRSILYILAWLLAGASVGWAAGEGPQLPRHRKVALTNGLTLLLMEQHEVPLVSVQIVVRAGGVADPAGKEGLALLTAELLRRGTQRRTADQIASELDFIGGTIEIGGDPDRVFLVSEFMKKDTAAALDLLSDLLRHPNFPGAEVEKLIKQRVDGIKQDKEEARAVLPHYFAAALFGSHPYARPPEGDERSLASIQRDDVAAFYERLYGPETTILAVAGDFVSAEMEHTLAEKLDGWKPRGRTGTSQPPTPNPIKGRKLLLVNKPDSTQTYFAIGNVGIARNNPDRTGVELVNLLFGGRFTSMLNEALRVNSGLTYGARSRFEAHQIAGPFLISSFTANPTTVKAIDMALDVLQTLHRDGVSEEQLRSAKDYLKGQFPPRIETTDQLAALLADLEFYGLDEREVNELFQRIDAFTTADARRVIDRYFPRENLVFALIGKSAEIEAAVKRYAPQIEKREIEQPGFK